MNDYLDDYKKMIEVLFKYHSLDKDVLTLTLRHYPEFLYDKNKNTYHLWPNTMKVTNQNIEKALEMTMMSKVVYNNLKKCNLGEIGQSNKTEWKKALQNYAYIEHLTPVNQTFIDIKNKNSKIEDALRWCKVCYIDKKEEAKILDSHKKYVKEDIDYMFQIFPKLKEIFDYDDMTKYIGKSGKEYGLSPLRVACLIKNGTKFYNFAAGKEMNNDEILIYLLSNTLKID